MGGMNCFERALKNYKEGKPHFQYLARFRLEELRMLFESNVVKKVQILATEDSCPNCKALNGKTFDLIEALKNSPLPCKTCTYELKGRDKGEKDDKIKDGWCRCCFVAVIED